MTEYKQRALSRSLEENKFRHAQFHSSVAATRNSSFSLAHIFARAERAINIAYSRAFKRKRIPTAQSIMNDRHSVGLFAENHISISNNM
jgi:hypothetical protein